MVFHLFHRDERSSVVIDYADDPDTITKALLDECLIYFKMQYRRGGYGDERIVQGMYVPTGNLEMYRLLPRLRRIRDDASQLKFDVYGRFSPGRASHIRKPAIEALRTQCVFRYAGGGQLVAMSRSLCEAARSKVCIDLPGIGPFCHRLVDYLAIGSCVVAFPHGTEFTPPLIQGKHVAYCRPDLSDLVDLCHYYTTDDAARMSMIRASREYFDTYLHKDCIAAYYLECIGRRLEARALCPPGAVSVHGQFAP